MLGEQADISWPEPEKTHGVGSRYNFADHEELRIVSISDWNLSLRLLLVAWQTLRHIFRRRSTSDLLPHRVRGLVASANPRLFLEALWSHSHATRYDHYLSQLRLELRISRAVTKDDHVSKARCGARTRRRSHHALQYCVLEHTRESDKHVRRYTS
jgi:hypothetical protein